MRYIRFWRWRSWLMKDIRTVRKVQANRTIFESILNLVIQSEESLRMYTIRTCTSGMCTFKRIEGNVNLGIRWLVFLLLVVWKAWKHEFRTFRRFQCFLRFIVHRCSLHLTFITGTSSETKEAELKSRMCILLYWNMNSVCTTFNNLNTIQNNHYQCFITRVK